MEINVKISIFCLFQSFNYDFHIHMYFTYTAASRTAFDDVTN